jgi:hypothetical protein
LKQRTVAWLLAAHTLVVWGAVPLRIDEFPLTWAPMYSKSGKKEPAFRSVTLIDKARLDREGWRATRSDGHQEWVRRADLNIARRNMRRLYYQRTWNQPPPRFQHKNSGEATLDRWLMGIPPGAPIYVEDWRKRLLISVNATLDRKPGDPDFIVTLAAERILMKFDRDTMEKAGEVDQSAQARWRPEWNAEFPR